MNIDRMTHWTWRHYRKIMRISEACLRNSPDQVFARPDQDEGVGEGDDVKSMVRDIC